MREKGRPQPGQYIAVVALETRALFGELWRVWRDHRAAIFVAIVIVSVMAVLMWPHDGAWTDAVRAGCTDRSLAVADFFSDWGDYPLGPATVLVVLLTCSFIFKRPSLRRLGLAVVLAASCAGLTTVTVRSLTGRPRPRSDRPDGFYGPSLAYELNSFPSGHTACAYATAFALVPVLPVAGVPALVFATGTAWSRIHSYHHHPTDVLVGGAIGALFGLGFGGAVRRRFARV